MNREPHLRESVCGDGGQDRGLPAWLGALCVLAIAGLALALVFSEGYDRLLNAKFPFLASQKIGSCQIL